MVGAIDSGWVAAIATMFLAAGTVGGVVFDRRRTARRDREDEAKVEAEAPATELTATSKAAEAIARAAALLIAPFQATIADMQKEHGALREAISTSRAAEEKCQRDLAEVRGKLREVTDRLGIEPAADPAAAASPPESPDTP